MEVHTMKIIQLIAENVKGLKAVNITPDEHFQQISGKNGQGKTSVLDSIWLALAGKDASKGMNKPIREGQESAFATVDLGDVKVTRKWKGDKTTLEVLSKEGAKFNSPQGMLDEMIGKLSFDPLAFANLDDKKQRETLQSLVGIDFTALDHQRKILYDDRTETNRDKDKYKSLLDKLPYPKDNLPNEELKAGDVIAQITAAQTQVQENENKRRDLDKLRVKSQDLSNEIKQLESLLLEKKEEHNRIVEQGKALKAEVEKLVDPDISELQNQLERIEETNRHVREAAEYKKALKDYELCVEESEELTAKIKEIDRIKEDTLQSAQFPIEGLSFDEVGVTYKGIPFKQCSAAERLKVSMAMAMALNPKLRVIRILDGSLLDSENIALIREMAKEKDYQVWVEVVDESGNMGIVIEDGQVKQLVKEA